MREVFVHQDSTRVGFFKSVLDEAGIANLIRNEHSNTLLTGMPSPVFFPALCVVHDEDYDRALELLREFVDEPPSQAPDWICDKCGAEVPGNFDSCWECGESRSGADCEV
jgi:hypothetical protein